MSAPPGPQQLKGHADGGDAGAAYCTQRQRAALNVPSDMKELYKTVREIKQRILVDMAAGRGAHIDQPLSLSIHMIDAG